MLLNPLMLAWICGAAVPLVLHLLSRSRYRPVHWGAMMFLSGGEARTHHAAGVKQWTLLLLRMSVVGLLAVALARPVIAARHSSVPTAGLTTGGPAAVVIILNDSASMGYTRDGKSRLDQAREVTLQILSGLKRGDQATLLLTGTRENQQPTPPSTDLQSIAAKVAALQPDSGQTDFATEMSRAADLLERAKPAEHEIYVITDQQALHWKNINDAFNQRWITRRANSPPFKITVFPVGGDESDNLTVEAIEVPERVVIRDQPVDLQVRVHNYGPVAVDHVPVAMQQWSTTRPFAEATVSLPAHSSRVVHFEHSFNEPGTHVIFAKLESTGLTSDDRLDYAVDVLEPLQMLLVSSMGPTSRPVEDFSAAAALDPLNDGRRGIGRAVVTGISPGQLSTSELKKTNVVILDDVPRLSAEQIRALQQFASAGGGILFLPGEKVAGDLKNNPLYQGGSELLPVALLPPVMPAKPKPVGGYDRQNAVFRFVGILPDPFARLPVLRYFPIGPRPKEMRVLARIGPADPFLIESTIGHGRVLLMTTALDSKWNSLVPGTVMENLLQSMVQYLGVGAMLDCNFWPGQAINLPIDEPVDADSAAVQFTGSAQRELASTVKVNDRTEIHYGRTGRPGIYRVHYKSLGVEKTISVVVAGGHADSDLTPLTDDQWKSVTQRVGFDRVDLNKVSVADAIAAHRGGREIWIELLSGVLLLMMLEMLLSRLWSYPT